MGSQWNSRTHIKNALVCVVKNISWGMEMIQIIFLVRVLLKPLFCVWTKL